MHKRLVDLTSNLEDTLESKQGGHDISLSRVVDLHKAHIGELYNGIAMRDVLIEDLKERISELEKLVADKDL